MTHSTDSPLRILTSPPLSSPGASPHVIQEHVVAQTYPVAVLMIKHVLPITLTNKIRYINDAVVIILAA